MNEVLAVAGTIAAIWVGVSILVGIGWALFFRKAGHR